MNFDAYGLQSTILTNIHRLGYVTPTPIQLKSIPLIIKGNDVMGLAQTGTGKTAAFVLPILQRLLETPKSGIRALIIAPTRELAQQIHETIVELAKGTKLHSITLYGGVNINPQIKSLKHGDIAIAVACPGRLLDHIQNRNINLTALEVLVLDEADQMFDMGFLPDIKRILQFIPKKRQTLLFSATMPDAIKSLAHDILQHPVTVQIDRSKPAESVKQLLYPVMQHLKTELLIHLLKKTSTESVLVFTRTKHTAKKVADKLIKAGFHASSLQGNLSQSKRQTAMNGFRDGTIQVLVATDIASRGIDVASISHVINYDIPSTVEAYIHRIGRTGRAAKVGDAFTLITPDNQAEVRAIEKVLGCKLEQCELPDFDYHAAPPARTVFTAAVNKKPQTRRSPRKADK